MTETVRVPESARGDRVDRFLAAHLDLPRNQIQHWLRDGRVRSEGRALKPSSVLEGREALEIDSPPSREPGRVVPEEGPLRVLYEDEHLIVVDKAAGLTVHPGSGQPSGTLANHLLYRYPELLEAGSPDRPGIVHRLDQGTSGVLVVARSPLAYRALSLAFADREIDKRYLAIAYGEPRPGQGEIDLAIGRHRHDRTRMSVRPDGRPALTRYRVVASAAGISLLELELHTGRTHQIRVHLKSLRHPLVGDPTYGEDRWRAFPAPLRRPLREFARPALHAWRLELAHPVTQQLLRFEAPLPEDLIALWQRIASQPLPTL